MVEQSVKKAQNVPDQQLKGLDGQNSDSILSSDLTRQVASEVDQSPDSMAWLYETEQREVGQLVTAIGGQSAGDPSDQKQGHDGASSEVKLQRLQASSIQQDSMFGGKGSVDSATDNSLQVALGIDQSPGKVVCLYEVDQVESGQFVPGLGGQRDVKCDQKQLCFDGLGANQTKVQGSQDSNSQHVFLQYEQGQVDDELSPDDVNEIESEDSGQQM
jgi:hypothetical protein